MLINGYHSLAKVCQGVASRSLVLLFGPKQHNINASGNKLYMSLKKKQSNLLEIKTIFASALSSNQMCPLSESSLGFHFLIHGIWFQDWFPVPTSFSLRSEDTQYPCPNISTQFEKLIQIMYKNVV